MVAAPVVASPSEPKDDTPSPRPSAGIRLMHLVGRLPFRVRSALGFSLGVIAGLIPTREKTIATLQLKVFLPEKKTWLLVLKTFGNAGRTILESINVQPLLQHPYSAIRCDNWHKLSGLVDGQRPVIVLTGHTGNWDLLAAYAIARGMRIATVGREARNATAQTILRAIREGYGIETIWRSDKSGIKKLISYLKQGHTIAALIDQDTRVESVHIPFLSEFAKTPSSLIALGKKYNAQFVTAFLFRKPDGTFEIFAEAIDESLSLEEILRSYNQRLETYIRQFPDQWVWFHKRWRTSPDGHTKSSREYIRWLTDKAKQLSLAVTAFFLFYSLPGCSPRSAALERAEELAREGQYDEAIATYRAHMQSRLDITDRPEWENPYFYLILIGDVQLRRGEPEAALAMYEEAQAKLTACEDPKGKAFHETLLSDRYRALATWHLEHEQLEKALEILRHYRYRDSLLFDAMLDRVARKLTERETTAPVSSKTARAE